jgi:drug/metabolite transporter (DMT)-like permease
LAEEIAMRPLGVTLIAIYHWLRACLLGVLGLLMIFAGGMASRYLSSMEDNPRIGALLAGLGVVFGVGALVFAVLFVVLGIGIWTIKNWARVVTIAVSALALLPAVLVLLHPRPFGLLRAAINVAIIVYLLRTEVAVLFERGRVSP